MLKGKQAILLLVTLFFWGQSKSQSLPNTEIIYLKNGSIIKGSIIEWVPNESITILSSEKNIFKCNIADILKVTREIAQDNIAEPPKKWSIATKVYETNISLGYGAPSGKYGLDVVCLNSTYGKNISKHHFLGMGTGIRHFDELNMTMVPIILDYRYRLTEERIAPYFRIATGYSMNVSNGLDNSGFLVDPKIGVEIKLHNSRLNLDFGYQTQQIPFLTITDPFNPTYFTKIYRFSESLKFSLGFSF